MFRQLSRSIRFQFQKMSTQTSPQPPKVPLGPYLKTRQPKWYDKYTVREKQIFARILYASTLGGMHQNYQITNQYIYIDLPPHTYLLPVPTN